jgi:U1 small nuclear ribonucleoprotein 70kDa
MFSNCFFSPLSKGGGLGGTRRGGPEVNIKHSGREDNERERERYRLEREREDRGGGSVTGRERGDRKLSTSTCI